MCKYLCPLFLWFWSWHYFYSYDFDRDGYITKEDVRLILSHIPIVNTIKTKTSQEGTFTQEGGGNQVFMDRVQTQEEISLLIANVFVDKKRLNYDDYVHVNQELSSEMFLSIISLLQTNLPCSVNFYRYKNNYEKYVGEEGKKSEEKEVIKTIASPRLMSKLSPVANLVSKQGLNVNPMSQKGLLKYAINKDKKESKKNDSSDSDNEDFSKFGSKKAQ